MTISNYQSATKWVCTQTEAECNAEQKAFDSKNNVCCGDNEEYDGECKACEVGYTLNDNFICKEDED